MIRTLVPILLFFAVGACGDDGTGGNNGGGGTDRAYLTIIGEDDLFGEAGELVQLTVRYHDGNDQPLAGTVHFSFFGDPLGSTLSRTEATTGIDGKATVELRYAPNGDAAFQVSAAAERADDANWRVTIGPRALDVTGKYRLDSAFVLPEGLPEGTADNVQTFVDMTNDPHDPATYLLDRVQTELEDPYDDLLAFARAGFGLDAMVNEVILDNAPDAIEDIRALGDGLDQIIRSLNPVTELVVTGDAADDVSPSGTHILTGAVFVLDGTRYEYSATQMELGTMTSVAVQLSRSTMLKLDVAQHTLHLPYGRLLQHGLDKVVVPSIDATAGNTTQLLANLIDCEAVGARLAEEVGFGTPDMWAAGCVVGVDAAIGELTGDLRAIEADLTITGSTDLIDGDSNKVVERFQGGLWEGQLVFSTGAVTLPRPNQTFVGQRIFAPTN